MIIYITGDNVVLECKAGGHSTAMKRNEVMSISPVNQDRIPCAFRKQYDCKEYIVAYKFVEYVKEMIARGETMLDTETGEVK